MLISISTQHNLIHLTVELKRFSVASEDYEVKVILPKTEKTAPTSVRLRSNLNFNTEEGCMDVAIAIFNELIKKGNKQWHWKNADAEHLAQMLYTYFTIFSRYRYMISMAFITEAIQ